MTWMIEPFMLASFGQGSLSFSLGSKTERKTCCGRWSKMAWDEVGGWGVGCDMKMPRSAQVNKQHAA
jgi:hypothetical protein